MTTPKSFAEERDYGAYKMFRERVPYIEKEQAEKMFKENRTLTAEAFKAGAHWALESELVTKLVATLDDYKYDPEYGTLNDDVVEAIKAYEQARSEHAK